MSWASVVTERVREDVKRKFMEQAHEVELNDPGVSTSGIVGTDEGWWYRSDERRREAVLIHQDRQRRHFRESPVAAIKRRIALADRGIFPEKVIEVKAEVIGPKELTDGR